MKTQDPPRAKGNLSKKPNTVGITFPDFKLYFRGITRKIAWYWHKNRQEDQWITTEEPDTNLHIYSQLIFNKEPQKHNGK
jgi:hypothetical protein